MTKLKLLRDSFQIISYCCPDFPVRAREGFLSDFPNMAIENHWHDDWEFAIILKGKMSYCINGKSHALQVGQTIFINARQMHYSYSTDGSDCQYICILLHPSLLSTIPLIKDMFVNPICTDSSPPFFILHPYITWQKELIEMLKTIYDLCLKKPDGFELNIMSIFYSLCYYIYENRNNDAIDEPIANKNAETMHNMVGYIQNNYQQKITLHDIATAGNVCRSHCCKVFQLILNKTPISYLTGYRLEKSIELLRTTSLSITEIALHCGFSGSSYFTEIFHTRLGCTPLNYRKRNEFSK